MADGRFAFARVIGEMPRSLSDSPQEELFAYESELQRFAPRYRQAILCLYDVDHFPGCYGPAQDPSQGAVRRCGVRGLEAVMKHGSTVLPAQRAFLRRRSGPGQSCAGLPQIDP
jgi:hypothetical protein